MYFYFLRCSDVTPRAQMKVMWAIRCHTWTGFGSPFRARVQQTATSLAAEKATRCLNDVPEHYSTVIFYFPACTAIYIYVGFFFSPQSASLLQFHTHKIEHSERVWCLISRKLAATYLCSPGCQHNAPHLLPVPPFDTALVPAQTDIKA